MNYFQTWLIYNYKPLVFGFWFQILSLIGRHKNVSAVANGKITRFIVPPITDKIQSLQKNKVNRTQASSCWSSSFCLSELWAVCKVIVLVVFCTVKSSVIVLVVFCTVKSVQSVQSKVYSPHSQEFFFVWVVGCFLFVCKSERSFCQSSSFS